MLYTKWRDPGDEAKLHLFGQPKRITNQWLLLSIYMVTLKLSEKQLDDLFKEMFSNADPRARKKCLIVYLRATGRPCHEIEDIARVDEDTVTNAVKKYVKSDLAGLLKENYRKPKSQLEPHNERLTALFEKQPPHTVNHAIDMILKKRGGA